MRAFGRILQHLGLVLLPLAILLQLLPGNARGGSAISVGQMLLMLVAGLCAFWIGRLIEGYSK